jgi:hypothetical protein
MQNIHSYLLLHIERHRFRISGTFLGAAQPAQAKFQRTILTTVEGQKMRRSDVVVHHIRISVVGDIIGSQPACPAIATKHKAPLDGQIELEEQRVAGSIHRSDLASFVLNAAQEVSEATGPAARAACASIGAAPRVSSGEGKPGGPPMKRRTFLLSGHHGEVPRECDL